jgi:hypothetical protein
MSPRLWFEHHQLMLDVFTSQNEGDYDEVRLVWEILNAAEVDERVQNLLFLNEPSMERTSLSIAVATMHVRFSTFFAWFRLKLVADTECTQNRGGLVNSGAGRLGSQQR